MSDFDRFAILIKLVTPTFQWHKSCNVLSSVHETVVFGIRVAGVISLLVVRFPMKIPCNLGMLLTNQDNQLLGKARLGIAVTCLFEKPLAFRNLVKLF